ncbi:MAG: hypothetical protein ABIB97_05935 [Patescibacteria group bacterium]
MLSDLEKAILATICYFDIFDFPLTSLEVWKWLFFEKEKEGKVSFRQVQASLRQSSTLHDLIDQKNGFYYLKNRERIVISRLENYKVAERKFKKAKRFIKVLRCIPFIKMVAVCNTLAFSNAGDYSDIDFFIITQKGRIWLARFWASLLPRIFGLRPTKSDTQDKLCLTFFIAEDQLNIESLQYDSFDIYLAHWIAQVMPIYDRGKTYHRFIEANNWASHHFPNFLESSVAPRRKVEDNWLSRIIKLPGQIVAFSFLGHWQESIIKKVQLKGLPDELKQIANQDNKVVINDSVLKFHDNDRRGKFKEMFQEKMEKLITNS